MVAAAAAPVPTPVVTLSATPTVVTLQGAARATISVTNPSSRAVTVDVSRGNYDITARGRVVIDPVVAPNRTAEAWISVSPAVLQLAPNGHAQVTVVSHPPKHAEPGDHHALVLLTSRPTGGAQVGIRTRIGIGVLVRMQGEIVRRLAIKSLTVSRAGRHRTFTLSIANEGNINEFLTRNHVVVGLIRRGKTLTRLVAPSFDLLPGATVAKTFVYSGKLTGVVTARVEVDPLAAAQEGPGVGMNLPPVVRMWTVRL